VFSNAVPEHIDTFVPLYHEFKNSIVVKIRLLHSQPFMNSHFQFLTLWNLTS